MGVAPEPSRAVPFQQHSEPGPRGGECLAELGGRDWGGVGDTGTHSHRKKGRQPRGSDQEGQKRECRRMSESRNEEQGLKTDDIVARKWDVAAAILGEQCKAPGAAANSGSGRPGGRGGVQGAEGWGDEVGNYTQLQSSTGMWVMDL